MRVAGVCRFRRLRRVCRCSRRRLLIDPVLVRSRVVPDCPVAIVGHFWDVPRWVRRPGFRLPRPRPAPALAATSETRPRPQRASATVTVKATAGGGSITIAPGRGHDGRAHDDHPPLLTGSCLPRSAQQFGTTAVGGLVYRYANHSERRRRREALVGFTNGGAVAGDEVTPGQPPNIALWPVRRGRGRRPSAIARPRHRRLQRHELRARHELRGGSRSLRPWARYPVRPGQPAGILGARNFAIHPGAAGIGMEVHDDSRPDRRRYRRLGGITASGRMGRQGGRAARSAAADRVRGGTAAADGRAPDRVGRPHGGRHRGQQPRPRPRRRHRARHRGRPRHPGRRRRAEPDRRPARSPKPDRAPRCWSWAPAGWARSPR